MAGTKWNILNVWKNSSMNGVEAEVTAEKDGSTVYVLAGSSEFGYHYVVSGESLFGREGAERSIIAEYRTQREALASEYAPLFRKALAANRTI